MINIYNSWVEVSKSAILHNLTQYEKVVGDKVEIMPIIKSNAYGHGMKEMARLIAPKVKWFGVVSLDEALALRRQNINNRILVLSYAQSRYLEEGIKAGIELPLYDWDHAKLISKTASRLKKNALVHIKIDTGTSRIGVLASEAVEFIKKIKTLPNIKIEGIYSHFASSESNREYTEFQLNNFNNVLNELNRLKIEIPYKHFACSASALMEPKSHFNLIRLGIALYGLHHSHLIFGMTAREYRGIKLKPALTFKTKIAQVKEVPASTKVGYGCTYTTSRKTKIAILTAGYWEGYDRRLGNKSDVLIKHQRCPVIGRICMNLIMADITEVEKVKAGDEAVLIGQQGHEEITAEELAKKAETISCEIITKINPLLPRIYIK